MKILFRSIITLLFGAAVLGCAQEEKYSANENEKEYLEAWLKTNYPDAVQAGNGIYILEDVTGNGAAYAGEEYVHVDYDATSLDGTISSSTDLETNKRIGKYTVGNYYGPKVWQMDKNTIPVGVEDMLQGMRIGGTRTALIPGWLSTYDRYKKSSDYINKVTSGTTAIYKVTLRNAFANSDKWELDSLNAYAKRNFSLNPSDTVRTGFFYIQTETPSKDKEFPNDTTIYINYIGRLLDGTVFDTSIADTAKFYGIYKETGSYGPVKISWADDVENIKMTVSSGSSSSSSTPVTGFQYTLWEMGPHEKGTGLFYSPLGYTISGSGNSIPSYSPLRFDIEVVDN